VRGGSEGKRNLAARETKQWGNGADEMTERERNMEGHWKGRKRLSKLSGDPFPLKQQVGGKFNLVGVWQRPTSRRQIAPISAHLLKGRGRRRHLNENLPKRWTSRPPRSKEREG